MLTSNQTAGGAAGVTATPTAKAPPTAGTGPDVLALLEPLAYERLEAMLAAGREIRECYRVLGKVGANVVGEILKDQGPFYEHQHYPKGDVFDAETFSQYYYHAHRAGSGEHGHFHTFLRAGGMPEGARPVPHAGGEAAWPAGDGALSHLIAISMDRFGHPTHLFTTNRWVTGEAFYPAEDVVRMLGRFAVDHAWPSWPTNRWLTAMFVLFRPQMAALVRERDRAIEDWRARHPGRDVYEDRELEITSIAPVSVDGQIAAVRGLLDADA